MELTKEYVLEQLEQHADELRSFGVTRIGLFGSVARNEATQNSDLDFVVEFRKYNAESYFGTAFFLEDLYGRTCDLVPIQSILPAYKDRIIEEASFVKEL